jgi:NAD+ synthase (glutamine-hydrolysing)
LAREITLNHDLGYLRIAAAVPVLKVADIDFNGEAIIGLMQKATLEGVQVLCFPEMALTGYTLGDLVQQQALLNKVEDGLRKILVESTVNPMVMIMGAPLAIEQEIFNCAIIINSGRILGIVPKTYLPTYKEFYDERWFNSGANVRVDSIILAGQTIPFGTDILFKLKDFSSAIIGV